MKKFLLLIVLFSAGIVWFKDWVTSGKMDAFIGEHRDPSFTPELLYYISEFYYISQQPADACHYYRWIVRDYSDHPQIAKIRWQLGKSYEELKEKDLAMEQYVILRDSFSKTVEGQLAFRRYEHVLHGK